MSSTSPARLKSSGPILASLVLQETVDFYTRKLGFVEQLRADDYLILTRDGVALHFTLCHEAHIARNTSCYIYADVVSLYLELRERGVVVSPPSEREWGMRELYVIDTHGNLLRFGEPV